MKWKIINFTEVNKTDLEEDKSNHLREVLSCNVIDNETEIKSNNEPDNEICDNTDNEIDNGNDPEYDFREQEATDSKYNKDISADEYLGNIPVHSKLVTSGILTNEKSKAEDNKTEEKLSNYEDIRKDYESDKNEEVYEKALTTKILNSRRKILLENKRSFRAYISR